MKTSLRRKQSTAYHSPHRFSDIHISPRSGGQPQITPPRSQVNWVTSISVSIVSLLSLSSCRNGAAMRLPTKGIDGGSKRRSGTRVPLCRRFDMSGRDLSSSSCVEETTVRVSKRRGAEEGGNTEAEAEEKKGRWETGVTAGRVVQEGENIERWKSLRTRSRSIGQAN